ncbi:MAG: hypothetical protein Tsb0021_17910 [Chlamydiales bacterium]
MNALFYVLVFLTAISITTYSRIQNYLNTVMLQQAYFCFMTQDQREDENELEKKVYQKHQGEKGKKGSTISVNATSKLNFAVFIDPILREKRPEGYLTIRILSIRLIRNIYAKHGFYDDFVQKHGDPAETLINSIMAAAEKNGTAKLINSNEELSKLDLEDEELQLLFAKMLSGSEDVAKKKDKLTDLCSYEKKENYPRLLDYIEVKKSKEYKLQPIRIQTVARPILEAIFIDPYTVQQVIVKRKELIDQFSKERKKETKEGSQELHEDAAQFNKELHELLSNIFESEFKNRIPRNLPPEMFNFQINTTAPNK